MKPIIVLIIFLIAGIESNAQNLNQDSLRKRKIEYYFQFQSGSLIGCNSCSDGKQISFSGSTTHGIKVGRKLRVGAGVGLDSYFEWNTVPIFGSVCWDLFGKKNALYMEMTYGDALVAWKPLNFREYGFQKTDAGRVYSYGLGYRIRYEKMRIGLGIGHKTQRVTSYYEYPTYYWYNNKSIQGDPSSKKVMNNMNRLMIWLTVGWK